MQTRFLATILIVLGFVWSLPGDAVAAEPARLAADGSLVIAGKHLRCQNVRARLDRKLPNPGAAAIGQRLLLINPVQIARMPETVQVFVFYHECGHHNAGASELGADCWAVERGVEGGWLDRQGLNDVCRSFGDAPETPTHPSGKRRCAHLDRCYAAAEVLSRARPRLVENPQLVRAGMVR